MEKFIYESRPYFYGMLSIWSVASHPTSLIFLCSSALLALATIAVFKFRHQHRAVLALAQKRAARVRAAARSPETAHRIRWVQKAITQKNAA